MRKRNLLTSSKLKGFTLIELLIVIGIIAILAGIIYVAVDPGRRFAEARDAERWSSVNAILNGYLKYTVDNKGAEPVSLTAGTYYMIGTVAGTCTDQATGANFIDLSSLVDTYLAAIPKDPKDGTAATTLYYIAKSNSGRITIGACQPERGTAISVSR